MFGLVRWNMLQLLFTEHLRHLRQETTRTTSSTNTRFLGLRLFFFLQKNRVCWDFHERWHHQICSLIVTPSLDTMESKNVSLLFSVWHPFFATLLFPWVAFFFACLSHMDAHAFFVFFYPSTPFPIKLCQKMVFTPSKALSLRPVWWTAREQSPAKPTAGCDPKSFQTCNTYSTKTREVKTAQLIFTQSVCKKVIGSTSKCWLEALEKPSFDSA